MDYSTLTVIASFLGLLIGIWKISSDLRRDLEVAKTLLFARFDDHKESVDKKLFLIQDQTDEKFVRSDMCITIQTSINGRLKSIETKLDALIMREK